MNFFLIKRIRGAVALEATLTLPIILYLMFFIIEILRLSNIQVTLDSIAAEMTFDFMGSKSTSNFDNIINKYRPKYISDEISWYFNIYENLNAMNVNENIVNEVSFTQTSGTGIMVSDYKYPEKSFSLTNKSEELRTLSQKAFVLTVVCKYKFASEFIGKCFFGVTNTEDNHFIIFSKCAGVCR